MKTASEEKFDSLMRDCHLILKPFGFKKKGNNFFLKKDGFGQHINFQKSSFGTKDDISFTINTGIFLPEYWSAMEYNKGKSIPDFPNGTDCMLIRRIGEMKGENDTWWNVNEGTSLTELTDTVLQNVRKVIIPYFNKIETKNDLKEVISSQPYSGTPFWKKMISDIEIAN